MDVTLFQHNKKVNSTLRPKEGSGTVYTGVLRDGCGILSPVVSIRLGGNSATAPRFMNYAYIEEFRRYYWISDWNFEGGLWTAYMRVDVLASWVYYIEQTSFFIIRASAKQNENVTDTMWPLLATPYCVNHEGGYLFPHHFQDESHAGSFIVGIASKNADPGMVSYYAMQPSGFNEFGDKLYSLIDNLQYDDLMNADIASIICNPMDYVQSCIWVPFVPATKYARTSISVGFWNVTDFSSGAIGSVDIADYVDSTLDITMTKHPQRPHGSYLNTSPYAAYSLEVQPWGAIDLQVEKFATCDTLQLYARTAVIDGSSMLWVRGYSNGEFVATQYCGTANVGCSVAVTGLTANKAAYAASSLVGFLGNAAGLFGSTLGIGSLDFSGWTPNQLTTSQSVIPRGIQNTINAVVANPAAKGCDGSPVACTQPVYLRSVFQIQAGRDTDSRGFALCENGYVGDIGQGYFQVMDGEVKAPCTQSELSSLKSYLESGFFYEVNI